MLNNFRRITLEILFMLIHITYAISHIYYGNDNVLWAIWGFVNIIIMFLSIGNAERINRKIARDKNQAYIIHLMIDVSLLIGLLFVGFNISILNNINPIYIIIYFSICLILIIKAITLIPKNSDQVVKNKFSINKIKDINSIDIDKDTANIILEKKNIAQASSLSTFVISIYVINFILFSVFNKNVTVLQPLVATGFIFVAFALNTIKLKYLSKNAVYHIIETGTLMFSMFIYVIFQLYIFPVTFNFLLMIGTSILLIPLFKTQEEIHTLMTKHFSE